jgi:hypothetical protein
MVLEANPPMLKLWNRVSSEELAVAAPEILTGVEVLTHTLLLDISSLNQMMRVEVALVSNVVLNQICGATVSVTIAFVWNTNTLLLRTLPFASFALITKK